MKKVTLLVPDEIVVVRGSADHSVRENLPTTPARVINALVTDDYHMNAFFEDRDQVRVLSLEDE